MNYFFLTALFSLVFSFANILGGKILVFPLFSITSGTLLYPITFFLSDLVTEIHGEQRARRMVLWGFFAALVAFAIHYFLTKNARLSGILILSSLLAFFCSQLLDIRLFVWIKKLTHGRHLWLRNQASTLISQLADTLIVNTLLLFWGLGLSLEEAYPIFLGNFCYKIVFTLVMIPLLYATTSRFHEKTS